MDSGFHWLEWFSAMGRSSSLVAGGGSAFSFRIILKIKRARPVTVAMARERTASMMAAPYLLVMGR